MEKSEGKNVRHLQAGGLDANQLQVAYKHMGRMVVGDKCCGPPGVRDGAVTMTIRKPLPRSYGVCCCLIRHLARLTCPAQCPQSLRSSLSVALHLKKQGTVPPYKVLRSSWAKA